MICYHHSRTQAVLVRCGQPLCGPSHKRCREDINLLNACLPSLSKGRVLDIRPQSVAQQHMSKGMLRCIDCLCSQWGHLIMENSCIIILYICTYLIKETGV